MNWADSSDDESDNGLHPARIAATTSIDHDLSYDDESHDEVDVDSIDDADLEVEEEKIPYPPPINMEVLPEDFPREAPFTAHVNNVAFNIKTEQDLANKIEGLVRFRYKGDKRVKVKSIRFGIDRETGKRRGFSYAEFETAEDLMLFLNINDGCSQINGRQIGINIARPPPNRNRRNNRRDNNNYDRRGNDSNVDGSKFRGGIQGRNNRSEQRERTSLKLAPRSKPLEENKPSNGDTWRSRKEAPGHDQYRDRNGNGRGRGRGQGRQNNGRGGGGRGKRGTSRNNNERSQTGKGRDAPNKPVKSQNMPAPMKVAEEKKNVTKVRNAFAAFALDSDSD